MSAYKVGFESPSCVKRSSLIQVVTRLFSYVGSRSKAPATQMSSPIPANIEMKPTNIGLLRFRFALIVELDWLIWSPTYTTSFRRRLGFHSLLDLGERRRGPGSKFVGTGLVCGFQRRDRRGGVGADFTQDFRAEVVGRNWILQSFDGGGDNQRSVGSIQLPQ